MRFLRFPTDHDDDKVDTKPLEDFRKKPRREKTRRTAKNSPKKRRGRRINWVRPTMTGDEE